MTPSSVRLRCGLHGSADHNLKGFLDSLFNVTHGANHGRYQVWNTSMNPHLVFHLGGTGQTPLDEKPTKLWIERFYLNPWSLRDLPVGTHLPYYICHRVRQKNRHFPQNFGFWSNVPDSDILFRHQNNMFTNYPMKCRSWSLRRKNTG